MWWTRGLGKESASMRTWPISFSKVCKQATIFVKLSHVSFPVAPTLATRISQASKNNGAPTCIMLAGNANRVTNLTRAFRPLKGEKGGEVCKVSSLSPPAYFVVAGIASIHTYLMMRFYLSSSSRGTSSSPSMLSTLRKQKLESPLGLRDASLPY